MCGIISKYQGVVEYNADTKGPQHGKIILGMHRRIQGRFRRSFDARKLSDHLHFKEIEKA
jgi:hypothetical protein